MYRSRSKIFLNSLEAKIQTGELKGNNTCIKEKTKVMESLYRVSFEKNGELSSHNSRVSGFIMTQITR